ncbi:MAG: hypothetical protein NC300_11455 [Bacteroidales bacterium]|nr:hypothetical protein [Clostridium sp.]MCM1204748.1 hypothetical protein [Bacteroidales bacterium]
MQKEMEMVKKHKIGLFLLNKDVFVRIAKGTTLTLSMNPKEEEFDYIADESPTTEITEYKPTIDQDIVMYKGSPDYEMMWSYFYERKVGPDAHTDCMVVFMHYPVNVSGNDIEKGSSDEIAGYRAWFTDSVISVQDMNATEKKLNFKVIFGGGVTNGYAVMRDGTPEFVKELVPDKE